MLFLLIVVVLSKEDQSIRISQSCATNLTGYFWNKQQCIQCKQPSCKCQNSQGCDSCLNQYYYDSINQSCIINIQSKSNYTPCPKGCIKCCKSSELTQYICTLCLDGYIMINGVCLKVDACTQISIHGRCQKCLNKYFLQESCQACPTGCSACDSKYFCTACDDSYYMAINEQSVSCLTCNKEENQSGCKTCVFDQEQLVCLNCLDTYYFDQENDLCLKCPSGCFTCQNPNQLPQICYTCLSGYLLAADDSYCQNCQEQFPNCMKCATNDRSRNFQCVDCNNGYYLTLDGKSCKPCNNGSNNFRRCDSETIPTQCNVGNILFADSANYSCIKNIHNCQLIDNSQGQCSECYAGFNLVFDSSLQMNLCKNCAQSIVNCITCDVDNNKQLICKQCSDGYFGNQCVVCTTNCQKCLNESKCQICTPGYYLDDLNQCQSCEVSFCMECTGLKQCSKCEKNYGLFDQNCKPCLTGCQNCDGGLDKCNICSDKYYLTSNDYNCKRYKENCLATNVNGYCYLCETQISYDESRNLFYDESEETPMFDEQTDSQFYISNNGYCLKCNDYITGTFNCPQICKVDEDFAPHLLTIILILLILN